MSSWTPDHRGRLGVTAGVPRAPRRSPTPDWAWTRRRARASSSRFSPPSRRGGNRPGARHRARHREPERRHRLGVQRAGAGNRLQDLSAAGHRGGAGRRERLAGGRNAARLGDHTPRGGPSRRPRIRARGAGGAGLHRAHRRGRCRRARRGRRPPRPNPPPPHRRGDAPHERTRARGAVGQAASRRHGALHVRLSGPGGGGPRHPRP